MNDVKTCTVCNKPVVIGSNKCHSHGGKTMEDKKLSIADQIANLVGIQDTDSPLFQKAVDHILLARDIERIKAIQLKYFNDLLKKESLTESEIEDLQSFKALRAMGML